MLARLYEIQRSRVPSVYCAVKSSRDTASDHSSRLKSSRHVCALIWLLYAFGGAVCPAGDSEPGIRHVLKSSQDETAYCSLLAPVGWQVERSAREGTRVDRYMFRPPSENYPYLMVDAWRADDGELERELEEARQLPEHPLLESESSSDCFDPVRSAVWRRSQSDRMVTVRVHLLRDPMLILQFAGAQPVDPAEQQTMIKVVDTIGDGSTEVEVDAQKPVAATNAAAVQPKFLLQTEAESIFGRRMYYWLAGLVGGGLLTLVAVERTLHYRANARRIREVEEQIQARQAGQSPRAATRRRSRRKSDGVK